MNYCSECGRGKKETIKQKFVEGKLWNGHKIKTVDNGIFWAFYFVALIAEVFLFPMGIDFLVPKGDFEPNPQFGVFLLIIATILMIILISMTIYDRGLRIVLKFSFVTFTIIFIILLIGFAIWKLAEIILEWRPTS